MTPQINLILELLAAYVAACALILWAASKILP